MGRLKIYIRHGLIITAEVLERLARLEHSKGRSARAVRLIGLADRVYPFAKRALAASMMYLGAGDLRGALAALQRYEQLFQDGVPFEVLSQTASILIELQDWSEAARYLELAHAAQPDDPYAVYALGSLLAYQGDLARADSLFAKNVPISTGNGLTTYSRTIRFEPSPSRPSPSNYRITKSVGDRAYLVASDSVYFGRYAVALARSISLHGAGVVLHFHVVNPDEEAQKVASRLKHAYPSTKVSFENVDLSGLSEWQRRTYYSCSRYLVLPEICRQYAQVVVADIDQVLIAPIAPLFDAARDKDVCLLKFDNQRHNLLSLISATIMVVGSSNAAMDFVATLASKVEGLVGDSDNLLWHADQAALAVTHLSKQDVEYGLIPESMVYLEGGEPPASGAWIFWSITNSVSENMAKLETTSFGRLALS